VGLCVRLENWLREGRGDAPKLALRLTMKNVFCTRRSALVERFYRRFAALTGGFYDCERYLKKFGVFFRVYGDFKLLSL